MVTFADYQIKARATMAFPEVAIRVGSTPLGQAWYETTSFVYPALGLAGELGELLSAMDRGDTNAIKIECGDVLWYVSMLIDCVDMSLDALVLGDPVILETLYPDSPVGRGRIHGELTAVSRLISERTKKALRDDGGKMVPKKWIPTLQTVLIGIQAVGLQNGWTVFQILEANLRKLADRQQRGKIQGDGDYR